MRQQLWQINYQCKKSYLVLLWPAKQGSALMDNSWTQAEHMCKCWKSWGGFLHFQDTNPGFLREEKEDGCWQGAMLLRWLTLRSQAKEIQSGFLTKYLALQNNALSYSLISKCTPLVPLNQHAWGTSEIFFKKHRK